MKWVWVAMVVPQSEGERAGCTVGKGLSGLRNENQCMADQESCMKEKLCYVEKLSIVELGALKGP